jgi:ubiquinone/menaquinone biosynthesis C-methylase UbiE
LSDALAKSRLRWRLPFPFGFRTRYNAWQDTNRGAAEMTIAKKVYQHYEPAGKGAGQLPLVENGRVLEIGFGTGVLLEALAERGNEVHGVDVGADIVEKAGQRGLSNVSLVDVSEEALPYADDHFDAVYCFEVMEHLTNPHRMFCEIRRTLKAEHCLYFSSPAQEIDMGYGYCRHPFIYPGLFEKENLERFFMQMYFRVEEVVEAGLWLEGRSYVLRNMKSPGKPDIVEVITGPHNLVELYKDVLSEAALQAELARETEPYLTVITNMLQQGRLDDAQGLCDHLSAQFPGYLPMYLNLAKVLIAAGKMEHGREVLTQLLGQSELSEDLGRQCRELLASLEAGLD